MTAYRSNSQKARILSEDWVRRQVYCPNCGNPTVSQYPNNQPVADFCCRKCREDYELKSKQNNIGTRVVDGAYRTIMERLRSDENPNLFLLSYDLERSIVRSFLVVPKHYFVPDIIEKRKPLAATARRAGWVGCNIVLRDLPTSGRIYFVRDGIVQSSRSVRSQWQKTLFLRDEKEAESRGWTVDVMRCIDKLGRTAFTLNDIYAFERELSDRHPANRHVKDKIRQQLQVLRDKGYLEFSGRGRYRLS